MSHGVEIALSPRIKAVGIQFANAGGNGAIVTKVFDQPESLGKLAGSKLPAGTKILSINGQSVESGAEALAIIKRAMSNATKVLRLQVEDEEEVDDVPAPAADQVKELSSGFASGPEISGPLEDPDGPDLADPGSDHMEGFLEKNHAGGKFSAQHEPRYFETEGYHVYYYVGDPTTGLKKGLAGHFDLRHVESIEPLQDAAQITVAGKDAIQMLIGEHNTTAGQSRSLAGYEKTMTIGFLDKEARTAWLELWCSAIAPQHVDPSLSEFIVPATSRLLVAKYVNWQKEISRARSAGTIFAGSKPVKKSIRYQTPPGYRADIVERREAARARKIAAEKAAAEKVAADEQARLDAEAEAARLAAEAEAARLAAMNERERKAAEEKARREAEEKARLEAEMKARLEEEIRAKMEAEMKEKLEAAEAEMQAKLEAAEAARLEAEAEAEAAAEKAAAAQAAAAKEHADIIKAEMAAKEKAAIEEKAAKAKAAALKAAQDMKTAEKATKSWVKTMEERAAKQAALKAAEEEERLRKSQGFGTKLMSVFGCASPRKSPPSGNQTPFSAV